MASRSLLHARLISMREHLIRACMHVRCPLMLESIFVGFTAQAYITSPGDFEHAAMKLPLSVHVPRLTHTQSMASSASCWGQRSRLKACPDVRILDGDLYGRTLLRTTGTLVGRRKYDLNEDGRSISFCLPWVFECPHGGSGCVTSLILYIWCYFENCSLSRRKCIPRDFSSLILSVCFPTEQNISAFFSRAKTASTIGTMVFFVALFPFFALTGDDVTPSSRRAGCLLPPTCLALGTIPFTEYEDSGEV